MPDDNKIKEFLKKLAPCIEHGDLDACVEEAARVAREMGIGADELLELSKVTGKSGKYNFAYVIAIAATQELDGEAKAVAYYNSGLAAKYLGKVEKAEEQYKLAIDANPNVAKAHYSYANLLKELNRKTEAEEQYKLAIAANTNDADAHNNYALLLSELNRKTEAEEQYKLAIDANSNYAEAHYNYALLLSELNRKTEAEEQYKLAIAANPNDADAHNNYATLLREKTMFFYAEKEIIKALQIDPRDPNALGTYGDILADEDYLEEAIEKYHEAIKNSDSMEHPAKAEIHNNLGWVYVNLEKYNRAKKEFEEAHKLDPQNVKVIRNIRALHKVKNEPKISRTQWCIAIVLFSGVIATWYLFWTEMLTENVFSTQFIILIAMLIFILFYHHLGKFKAGPIEFEKSTEHRSQPSEAIAKIERYP